MDLNGVVDSYNYQVWLSGSIVLLISSLLYHYMIKIHFYLIIILNDWPKRKCQHIKNWKNSFIVFSGYEIISHSKYENKK